MGMRLCKTTESHQFGNRQLVEFLEEHGGEIGEKAIMDVPASAFRAALEHSKELGLSEKDIAFIQNEIEGSDDEDIIDMYDLDY